MILRAVLTIATFASVFLFPWPFTVLLALSSALFVPLLPLTVGIFADTLYYTPSVGTMPLLAIGGAAATLLAFFVRSRLGAARIGG